MRATLDQLRHRVERKVATRVLASPLACRLLAGWRAKSIDGRHVAPDLAALLRLTEITRAPHVASMSPAEARRDLARAVRVAAEPVARDVESHDLLVDGPASPLRVRCYVPRLRKSRCPAMMYLHGGGWVTGDVDVYHPFCSRLASATRAIVFSVDYRLAPEHQFPSQPDDCITVWRWLASQVETFDFDPRRVAVVGDSAGGSLSALVAQETMGEAFRPALQVLIYPSLDATFASPSHASLSEGFFLTRASIDWYLAHYAGPNPDRKHRRLSPLLAPDPMPETPAIIYTSGFDPLRDEGQAYAARLTAAGAAVFDREFSDMVHGFVLMAGVAPRTMRATEEIRATLARVLHAPDIPTAVRQLK